MAMSGTTLGNAIGTAFYNAIPQSVKDCMTSEAKTEMCNSLKDNATIIADCVVAHIQACADIVVASGIPVSTTGSAAAQKGSTTGTGTATIS